MMKHYCVKEYSVVPPPYGGVSVYLMRLIMRLNKEGISTGGYYSAGNNDEELKKSPLFDRFEWDTRMSRLRRFYLHIRRIWRASKEYKIIHFHGQEMLFLPALILIFGRSKIVVTVHNSMIVDFYYNTSFLNRWGFRYLARNDVQWIAVSEDARNELLKLPLSFKRKIVVIPAYVPDVSSFTPLPNEMLSYCSNHEKVISFYGRSFMVYKGKDVYGFRDMIRAYSQLKNTSSFSVGLILCISETTDTESLNKLHEYASSYLVDKDIYWQLGGIKGIRAIWKASDVYVRPTFTDGDSVSVRDALAEGTSVVASDVCERPAGTILYKYGDDLDLVEMIRLSLLNNRKDPMNVNLFYNQIKDIYLELLQE